jgi:hypothetical protein
VKGRGHWFRVFWLSVLTGVTVVSPLHAAAPVFEDTVEDYTVVAGDTIADITRRVFGDETYWQDNWRLNPQVRDPDLLRIGQRLRIITARRVIAERAEVVQAVNRTEKMLVRPRWQPASAGDTLGSGQGLRTRENSTAELRFNAESSLRLDEFSQVFLAAKETSLRGVDRGSIAVERGTVDLVFAPLQQPRTQIELIAGPSTTTPELQAGQATQLRTGATDDGGARVMVYSGRTQVSADGSAVAVAAGMGTRVPERGPPTPPEALLAAPQPALIEQRWNFSNGRLHWTAVAGAVAYQVQVCADAACARPQQRARVDAPALGLQVQPLPIGLHHWQVLAISATGLDGYASAVARVQVDDVRPDLEPPMLAVLPHAGYVYAADGSTRFGPEAHVLPRAFDERSGVERIELRLEDGAWSIWDGAPIGLIEAGASALQLRAVDRLGQASPVLSVRVFEDE